MSYKKTCLIIDLKSCNYMYNIQNQNKNLTRRLKTEMLKIITDEVSLQLRSSLTNKCTIY